MKTQIEKILRQRVEKLIREHEQYMANIVATKKRCTKYGSLAPPLTFHTPSSWTKDNKFNPYYVRGHFDAIQNSLSRNLKRHQYIPNAPHILSITKNGKLRNVAEFSIPDEAVSLYYYQRLLKKNRHRFSSLAYAYRDDRNIHHAINDIEIEVSKGRLLYIAEFDFKDFFGSIDHNFLKKTLSSGDFNITAEELDIIQSFLPIANKGIYLGTSISLFLANAVCFELDRRLEEIGVRFCRYADDTIIWSENYGRINQAHISLSKFSELSGVPINYLKSEGISAFTRSPVVLPETLRCKSSIFFCGYHISLRENSVEAAISIPKKTVNRIKENIQIIINRYLVRPAKKMSINSIGPDFDAAYLSSILQIRRYIYGQLTDSMISNYLRGMSPHLRFTGLMSFYPLLNDEKQLKDLDSWLHKILFNTINVRRKAFLKKGISPNKYFPYSCSRTSFIRASRVFAFRHTGSGQIIDGAFQVPSFCRILDAIQKGINVDGISGVTSPKSNYYNN